MLIVPYKLGAVNDKARRLRFAATAFWSKSQEQEQKMYKRQGGATFLS